MGRSRRRPIRDAAWAEYLAAFHRERPGITEQLLRRASCEGSDPYGWCAVTLGSDRVLDVACGSGPMAAHVASWVGVDSSSEELMAARAAGRGPLIMGTASRLPFPDEHFGAAVSTMALQVVAPLSASLSELARVTRPGAVVVMLLPSRRPLPWRDRVLYLRLQLGLGRPITYPNDSLLARRNIRRLVARHRMDVVDDACRGFTLPLTTFDDAVVLAMSLYLPGVSSDKVGRAVDMLARRVGSEVTVPLRRVVLRRSDDDSCPPSGLAGAPGGRRSP